MTVNTYETLQERVFHEKLDNGLEVFLVPKPGFSKTYAVFTTRYGSIDNHFQVEGESERRVVDGIAHFLEHKLFEEEWGDIFHTFSANGASANAFTSHQRTAYLFSATEKVALNVETLLDFVQRPHLTPENVAKEQGIIEQEIRMYDEMPFWRGYRQLLENLFQISPVRIDIAGTVESIHQIDRDALMSCYETFYHPANMVFCVVGDFDPEQMMALVRDNQAKKTFAPARAIKRFGVEEPAEPRVAYAEICLPVARPLVLVGWKDAHALAEGEHLRRELLMGLVLDILFGRASAMFQALLDRGLVDDSFSFDYEVGTGYGFSYLGSETDDPQALLLALREGIQTLMASGIPPEDFERARRKQLGDYLHSLNSPEAMANHITDVIFKAGDYFRVPELITDLRLEEANAALREHFDPAHSAVSLVLPSPDAPNAETKEPA